MGPGIVVEEGRLIEVWRARCGGVSGGEFVWDEGGLSDACESGVWAWWGVSALEVDVAVGGVGWGGGWSGGPARVVSGMLGATGGTYWCSVDGCCVCGAVVGGWRGSWGLERGLDGGCLQRRG